MRAITLPKGCDNPRIKMLLDITTALDSSEIECPEDHARILQILDDNEHGAMTDVLYKELIRLVGQYTKTASEVA
jgi:hypothetical protein